MGVRKKVLWGYYPLTFRYRFYEFLRSSYIGVVICCFFDHSQYLIEGGHHYHCARCGEFDLDETVKRGGD